MWNPKLKDFITDDTTLIGLAWSCYWRVSLIIWLVAIVISALLGY